MNFGPREINSPAFEEYGIKSDSSSTLGVSQVIEWEGQSFSTVSAMALFFYGAGSDFIKQHVSVQSESNVPFENLVRTYCTMAGHAKHKANEGKCNFFGEACIHAGTVGLTDLIAPPFDFPSSETQVDYNSPHADPLSETGGMA